MTTSWTRLGLAFASGCATAALAGWLGTELRAQARIDPGDTVLHACASADGVLHTATVRAACPAGQQSLFFQRAAPPPPQGQQAPSSPDPADARIKALEQRVAALEREAATGTTHRVMAPFEVVDKGGHRVLLVDEDHTVRLYNLEGIDVARLEASTDGGLLVARNGAGMGAVIGASKTEAGFKVVEAGGLVRTDLGRSPTGGNYRLLFNAPDGKTFVAGMGESNLGTGLAYVADKGGVVRASMGASASGGQFAALNKDRPVATLTEGKTGGGLLEIGNSGGERMVVAGVQPEGFGVVQAGPASFMQAAGLGLPGSYIMGKAK
jgi:hypothetical protein